MNWALVLLAVAEAIKLIADGMRRDEAIRDAAGRYGVDEDSVSRLV